MRVISGSDSIPRHGEYPICISRLDRSESAFAAFNPTEEPGLLRIWNNPRHPFGCSPTSQREVGRLISHSDIRDESPFDDKVNFIPLANVITKSYFTHTGLNNERELESKHNY